MGADEAVDALSVHEVGAQEACEGERGFDGSPGGLCEAEEQPGAQGDGDLYAHGILADAEEVLDLEVLLDPPEEQLDGPAPFVEIGDVPGRGLEVVGEEAQHLAGVGPDPNLAHRPGASGSRERRDMRANTFLQRI